MANYWFLALIVVLATVATYSYVKQKGYCFGLNEEKIMVFLIICTGVSLVAFLSSIESVKYASSVSANTINLTYEVTESNSSVESFSLQNVDVSNFSLSCFDRGNATEEFTVDGRLLQWANSREGIDFVCSPKFKDEEQMRLTNNEWKCYCAFDYGYEVNQSFTRRTHLSLFNVTNFTRSGCIENCDRWNRGKTQYGKKSWVEWVKVNDTLLSEEKAYNIRAVKAKFENTSFMKVFPEAETETLDKEG